MSQDSPRPRVVVRKKGHGGHHGGAWKVAYADFVTTMMALFIVLWIVGQGAAVREAIAKYFRDPGAFKSGGAGTVVPGGAGVLPDHPVIRPDREPGAGSDERALEAAAEDIRDLIESAGLLASVREQIRVEVTSEGLRVELREHEQSAFFRVGSAAVLESLRAVLEGLAPVLAALPHRITVEGHTDSRQFSATRAYSNWELSTDRAHSARRILESSGLAPGRVDRIVGYADNLLLLPADPLHASNRRITIIVRRQAPASPATPGRPGTDPAVSSGGQPAPAATVEGVPRRAG